MSRIIDGTTSGPAPTLVPSFDPLIFRDTLRVSPWPTMPGASTTGFPSAMPTPLPLNTEHSDMADELGQQINSQYSVVNPRRGPYSPTLLSAADYLFSVAQPISAQSPPKAANKQLLGSGMTSAVYAMTLSMINHYLRTMYAEALTELGRIGLQSVGHYDGMSEEDFLDVIDAQLENNQLTKSKHNLLHYLLPRGVVRLVTPLGPSAAQSNALYQPMTSGDITSLSADTGQTVITVGERGSNQLRNFWGKYGFMPMKHLWFIVKPLQPDGEQRADLFHDAPQVVPWVSDDSFDTSIAPKARAYFSVLRGPLAKAPMFYVGMVLGRKGRTDAYADSYRIASGLGTLDSRGRVYVGDVDNLSACFTQTEMLGTLTVNATQKLNESYLRWM